MTTWILTTNSLTTHHNRHDATRPGAAPVVRDGPGLTLPDARMESPVDPTRRDSIVGHPESPPPGPPFTLDDLIDFHMLLAEGRQIEPFS